MSIIDLKELVENYAFKFFKDSERSYYKKFGKAVGWRELSKEIDWKNFRIHSETTFYKDLSLGQPKSHVLFQSVFLNDTTNDQDYNLKAERKTTSTCEFEIFEGYLTEGEANLSVEIPVPGCVLSAGGGFKKGYALEKTSNKSVQEETTWSVESCIKVPAMSRTTAKLVVAEKEYKGKFEIKSYFSGGIRIKVFKDSDELLCIDLDDLEDIFTSAKGFKKDQNGLYRISSGECRASFGIEQNVELHQAEYKPNK